MQLSRLLFLVAAILTPIALLSTTWLYLYPIFHACEFPLPPPSYPDSVAPFRLLGLGDPQLEGDSSLPDPNKPVFPSLEGLFGKLDNAEGNSARWGMLRVAAKGVVIDAGKWLEGKRKAVDLWGNDWYLAHIVRCTRWWAEPTHVTVLGDLLGSQWITEGEFEKRAGRYWGVVMRGLKNVPSKVFGEVEKVREEEQEQERQETEDEVMKVQWDEVSEETNDMGGVGEVPAEIMDSVEEMKREDAHEQVVLPGLADEGAPEQDRLDKAQEGLKDTDENIPETTETELEDDANISLPRTPGESVESHEIQHHPQVETENISQQESTKDDQRGDSKTASEEPARRSELFMALEGNIESQSSETEGSQGDGQEKQPAIVESEHAEDSQTSVDNPESNQESEEDGEGEVKKELRKPMWGGTTEVLGADSDWENRVINIAGNHDVGYAGDLDDYRVERFEKAFGSVNWDIWFTLPERLRRKSSSGGRGPDPSSSDNPPALRLVILNSMNLDTPAWNSELQSETYSFMNHIITSARPVEDKTHATVLLTHIPLEKQAGICVDSPYFNFFDEGHGVREQNMLSDFSTKTILEGIFGMNINPFAAGSGQGRRGIILNGHDHEGCDTVHYVRQDGILDHCDANQIRKQEAYWPAPASGTTTASTTSTSSIFHPEETSPANPLIQEISPAPQPTPEPELEEPESLSPWRAKRFPYRQYDVVHDTKFNITTCTSIDQAPHIREITLRSMMGEFSGYAGFLSAWFDTGRGEKGEWVFELKTCGLGIQHWWWAVHIIDFILVVLVFGGIAVGFWESVVGANVSKGASVQEGKNGTIKVTNGNGRTKS